jgi:hypothetical protein
VLVLTFVAVPVLLGGPLLLAAVLPVSDEARPIVGACGMMLSLSVFTVLAIGFAVRRTRVLDPGFAQLGVSGSGWLPNIREYHGTFEGRPLDATYARRGGILELTLAARTATKMSIGRGSVPAMAREILGLQTLPAPPQAPDWVIAASDPAWASALLREPDACRAIAALLDDPSGREVRWVLVRPGAVQLARRWIDPDRAVATVPERAHALAAFARACERMAAPARAEAAGSFELSMRKSPTRLAVFIVLGILGLLVVPAVVLAMALLASSSSPRQVAPTVREDVPVVEPGPSEPTEPREPLRRRRRRER